MSDLLTSHPSGRSDEPLKISPTLFFVVLGLLAFALRIFYSRNLYQDDGLWFTSAQEILRGKILYRDVYFDKPPVLPLVYAGLFKLFGAHILTIRLFTIIYSLGISTVLYLIARRLYGRVEGLVAAAMFTVFSTTFTTGHMQGLNTDFLMVLPYSLALLFFLDARSPVFEHSTSKSHRSIYALLTGLAIGVGVQTNPKAIFDLAFLAIALLASRRWLNEAKTEKTGPSFARELAGDVASFGLILVGVVISIVPFLVYYGHAGGLNDYWRDVWDWGSRYAHYYSFGESISSALSQTGQYFGLNPLLLLGLVIATVKCLQRINSSAGFSEINQRADLILLIWFVISYVGLATGGRFFGHYFFQLLPSLCILASSGLIQAIAFARNHTPVWRRVVLATLIIAASLPIVRFHGRTVSLALEWMRGSQQSADWLHARLNQEEKDAAEAVTDDLNEADAAGQIRRSELGDSPDEYLFVWGYRPEIYFWSGLRPATRFLSSQPLTGVPADVHYFGDGYRPLLTAEEAFKRRQQLLEDLSVTEPKYIIDELEFFNTSLAMQSFPDLQQVMARYRKVGVVGRFVIYIRRDLTRHYIKRHSDAKAR